MTVQKLAVIGSLSLSALLAAGVAVARVDAPAPEKELRAAAEQFAQAWNRDDHKAMAAAWAEDGDLINPAGHAAKGRAELEKFFARERGEATKGTTFKVTNFSARMLQPDLALEDFDVEISGGTMAPDPAKPLHDHGFAVAKKQGGHWSWVSLRAWMKMAPPAAEKH